MRDSQRHSYLVVQLLMSKHSRARMPVSRFESQPSFESHKRPKLESGDICRKSVAEVGLIPAMIESVSRLDTLYGCYRVLEFETM
jgi:hypothetical protein